MEPLCLYFPAHNVQSDCAGWKILLSLLCTLLLLLLPLLFLLLFLLLLLLLLLLPLLLLILLILLLLWIHKAIFHLSVESCLHKYLLCGGPKLYPVPIYRRTKLATQSP